MTQRDGSGSDAMEALKPAGWTAQLDLRFISATDSEVVAELPVSAKHYQPMGIVHGGVYCSMVETVCSVGAHLSASKNGRTVVGVDNQTSFIKATREGVLRVVAKPIATGRRTQLWEAHIHDQRGQLIATGRVRLICLEPEQMLAGQSVAKPASKPAPKG